MRAISIEVNESTGVGGFIFPGDYVDLISTYPTGLAENPFKAEKLTNNTLVVAVDQTTSRDASSIATIVKTITVEVTPEHATAIAKSKLQGEVSVSLQGLLE